jgi:glucosamine-6-phosphate deaminase
MDEYVGLDEEHPESYHRFMWDNFFSHIEIKREHVNILDGLASDLDAECGLTRPDSGAGGVDLFFGGVGADGHIAFNEPRSSLSSRTRVKTLTKDTRIANSRFFRRRYQQGPTTALTVGVGTVWTPGK